MADYFTHFSEVVPHVKPEEEAWLQEQLQMVQVFDGQEYADDNVPSQLAGRGSEWQGCRFLRDIEDAEEYDECSCPFGYEFVDDEDETPDGWGRHLWLHDDEGAQLDCVVHLVQKFLRRFRPHDIWSLTYAQTCSRPRVGEFGGGAIVVTANEVQSRGAHGWVEEQREALQRKAAAAQQEATG